MNQFKRPRIGERVVFLWGVFVGHEGTIADLNLDHAAAIVTMDAYPGEPVAAYLWAIASTGTNVFDTIESAL
jgi:hypothetical protein